MNKQQEQLGELIYLAARENLSEESTIAVENALKAAGWIAPDDYIHAPDVEAEARKQGNRQVIVYEVVKIIDHPNYKDQLALIEGPCGPGVLTLKLLERGGTVSPIPELSVVSIGTLAVPTVQVDRLRHTVRSTHFARVMAWLLRNEGVDAEAIERAVTSARDMQVGDPVTLTDDNAPMRRAFVNEQVGLLESV
jgi:hypothetical protein